MQVRNYPWLLFPVIGLSILGGCKKEKNSSPVDSPVLTPRIKTSSYENDLRNYFYDDKGRVTKATYTLYGREEYSYTDTGVVDNFYDTTNVLIAKTVYHLGANGLLSGYAISATDVLSYQYTSGKQLSFYNEVRNIPGSLTREWDYNYFYTNNNLDSIKTTLTYGGVPNGMVMKYFDEYYTDQISTLTNDNYGLGWKGVSSKNPVKTARDLGTDNNGNYAVHSYTYTYDSQNRITAQIEHFGAQTGATVNFTYY